MKYLITENNSKWTNDYLDVRYYQTSNELRLEHGRILGATLNDDNTLSDYVDENATETYSVTFTDLQATIEVEWLGTYDELSRKNTIVIQQDVDSIPKFYFINSVSGMDNNNMYVLDIEENIFLNHYDVLKTGKGSYPKQIGMTRGHLPIELYKNKTFDTGDYEILNKRPVERINDNTGINTPWIYVFEKTNRLTEDGSSSTSKPKLEYVYDIDSNKLVQPYSVKIAPVYPIDINLETNDSTLVDNGSPDKDDSTGNRYLKQGNTLRYNVGDLITTDKLRIEMEFFQYQRDLFLPFTSWKNSNPLDVNLSDIYDKYEYYVFGENFAAINEPSKKWREFTENIDFGSSVQIGIYAIAERTSQIVKIKYNSTTNEIEIVDISFDDYNTTRQANGWKSIDYTSGYINGGNGRWEEWPDRSYQYDWFRKNVEMTGDQQVFLKRIKRLGGTPTLWKSDDLIDYIEDSSVNADIINVKISNFNPIKTSSETIDGFESVENCSFDGYGSGQIAQLLLIDEVYSSQQNQYRFNLDLRGEWYNNLNLLDGLANKKLMIENQKIFDINIDNVDLTTSNVAFIHRTIPSPNEWEERIQWVYGQTIYDERTIWNNEKEGFTPTNEFSTYKSNNPVQSKLDVFGGLANPLTYIGNPISGAISGLGQAAGAITTRQNMKRAPEDIKGSGNIYPDLLFNEYNSQFILVDVKPKGTDWLEEINGIYRNGISFDSTFHIFPAAWTSVRRPRFNYVAMNNFIEFMEKDEYNKATYEKLDEVLTRGIRFWYDDNIGEYAPLIDDNNDVFESFGNNKRED